MAPTPVAASPGESSCPKTPPEMQPYLFDVSFIAEGSL